MDTEELSSLYSEVLNGVPKERSRFRRDPEFEFYWDRAVAWLEQVRAQHPAGSIDLPQ